MFHSDKSRELVNRASFAQICKDFPSQKVTFHGLQICHSGFFS